MLTHPDGRPEPGLAQDSRSDRLTSGVQSHGALIAVDTRSLSMAFASENAASICALCPDALLGADLGQCFDRVQRHALINAMSGDDATGTTRDVGAFTLGDRTLWVSACMADPFTVFQFEPILPNEPPPHMTLRDLSLLLRELQSTEGLDGLYQTTAMLLRMLTGYDRVLIAEDRPAGAGLVVAESASGGLETSLDLQGLLCALWAQDRKGPLAYVADVHSPPTSVLKADADLPDLDLSGVPLVTASDTFRHALRRSGHRGAMDLRVGLDGRPWGRILLLHRQSRRPTQSVRQICTLFLPMFSARLALLHKHG